MSFRRRARRPDDWSTKHARAQAALSDRLDGVIDPGEAAWLDGHLNACAECRATAVAYEAQHTELRAMRDQPPTPPRDLWARTAAAIEHESRFRDQRGVTGGSRRRRLAWAPLFAAALVVAVVVGTLTSSRLLVDGGPTAQPDGGTAAGASGPAASDIAFATPIPVGQHVQWISRDANGNYRLNEADVRSVCPNDNEPCDANAPVQDQHLDLTTTPQTVFGDQGGKRLIVVNGADVSQPASISVVAIAPKPTPSATPRESAAATPPASATVAPSETPATTASAAPPSKTPTPSGEAASSKPSPTPTPTPAGSSTPPSAEPTPSATPTQSVAITPSPTPGGAIEIAQDVVLVGQSAAYSRNGDWFAFTARPSDGSGGPDIYVWKVGEPEARAITTDHRSTFGSWLANDTMVGSSVVDATEVPAASPATGRTGQSFLLDPATGTQVALPQTGSAWRPSVDPSGRRAVYWTGSLRRSGDAPVDLPDDGRLVIGDWVAADAEGSDAPAATPLTGDQGSERHETTIAHGRLSDWDARWDASGTKLAVWIADPKDPNVGALSLYDVDPFNGRVDLKKPLLDARRATTGFSISDGKLVWAEPAEDGSGTGRILVLAWTEQGVGKIETLPDKVLVIR